MDGDDLNHELSSIDLSWFSRLFTSLISSEKFSHNIIQLGLLERLFFFSLALFKKIVAIRKVGIMRKLLYGLVSAPVARQTGSNVWRDH